jgi:hypothetical protein
MAKAAGGTSQRLKPLRATEASLLEKRGEAETDTDMLTLLVPLVREAIRKRRWSGPATAMPLERIAPAAHCFLPRRGLAHKAKSGVLEGETDYK